MPSLRDFFPAELFIHGLHIRRGVIPKSNFTSTQLEDIMAGKRTINGYIWHHNAQNNAQSAPNNMQLVPLEIHDAVRHTGQNALKKGR